VVFDVDGDLRALDKLQKSLLDALPAYISAIHCFLSCNLVKFVKDHDSVFSRLDVVVGIDEETLDACFDILSYVSSLCKRIAVAYCEGNVKLLA